MSPPSTFINALRSVGSVGLCVCAWHKFRCSPLVHDIPRVLRFLLNCQPLTVVLTLRRVIMDGFASNSGVYNLVAICPTAAPTNVGDTLPPSAAPTTQPQPVVVGTLACGTTSTGNTTGGTHTVGMGAPEEWWMFTSPVAGVYTFNTCGSNYDT